MMETAAAALSPPASLVYRLAESDLRRRAAATAWVRGGTAFVPALLVLVVLSRFGLATTQVLWTGLTLMTALLLVRVAVVRRALVRRLRALTFEFREEGLRVLTLYARYDVLRADIERAVDIDGEHGGVRLVFRRPAAGRQEGANGTERPRQIDIPRGGDRFGDVREWVSSWQPLVRPNRRRRSLRLAVGVLAIALIFFFPFVADGLSMRGRLTAAAFVVGIWFSLRIALQRD